MNREPLTLEQLMEMDGQPIFLPEANCWALVTKDVFVMLLTFQDGEKCSANDWYKQVGPAYAYPPAHINLEGWNDCSACGRPQTEEAWAELEKRLRG